MRSDTLDRSIMIERRSGTLDAYGVRSENWTEVVTVQAQVVEAVSEERERPYGEAEETTVLFRLRWIAASPGNRILYDGRVYDIRSLKELGRRRGLEIRATARAA